MTKGQRQVRNQHAWKTISKNSRSRAFWMSREAQQSPNTPVTNLRPRSTKS